MNAESYDYVKVGAGVRWPAGRPRIRGAACWGRILSW